MEKAKLLSNKPNPKIQQELPTPSNAIEYTRSGTILGKQIHLGNKPILVINDSIHKAKQTWGLLRNKLFLNEGIKTRIRIQLWNALVRSTQTYALQTQNTEQNQCRRKMEGFAYKWIRKIHNKHWYKEDKKLNRDAIYENIRNRRSHHGSANWQQRTTCAKRRTAGKYTPMNTQTYKKYRQHGLKHGKNITHTTQAMGEENQQKLNTWKHTTT